MCMAWVSRDSQGWFGWDTATLRSAADRFRSSKAQTTASAVVDGELIFRNGHPHCSRSAFIGSVRAAVQPGRRLPQHVTSRMIMGAARKLGTSHTLTP